LLTYHSFNRMALSNAIRWKCHGIDTSCHHKTNTTACF
jgi:hypothetical protein